MYWIGRTEVAVLNSQVFPISQVVLKTGFTVLLFPPRPTTPTSFSWTALSACVRIKYLPQKGQIYSWRGVGIFAAKGRHSLISRSSVFSVPNVCNVMNIFWLVKITDFLILLKSITYGLSLPGLIFKNQTHFFPVSDGRLPPRTGDILEVWLPYYVIGI